MSETQWIEAREPGVLLDVLFGLGYHTQPDGPRARRLRLFACACCRRIAVLLSDPRSLAAIETGERFATGQVGLRALKAAHEEASQACWSFDPESALFRAAQAVCWATFPASTESAVVGMARHASWLSAAAWKQSGRAGATPAGAWQVHLLRDLFGNPFQPAGIDPLWLAREGGLIRQLAEGIDADQAFDRMPILADALEEVGCADVEILKHGRSHAVHVRGCWLVDALLGRT